MRGSEREEYALNKVKLALSNVSWVQDIQSINVGLRDFELFKIIFKDSHSLTANMDPYDSKTKIPVVYRPPYSYRMAPPSVPRPSDVLRLGGIPPGGFPFADKCEHLSLDEAVIVVTQSWAQLQSVLILYAKYAKGEKECISAPWFKSLEAVFGI